jgi:hypothetical protein
LEFEGICNLLWVLTLSVIARAEFLSTEGRDQRPNAPTPHQMGGPKILICQKMTLAVLLRSARPCANSVVSDPERAG